MNFNHRYTFTLESRLSNQGITTLINLLSWQSGEWLNELPVLPPLPFDFEYAWMTEDGKFTKRIAKYYYQNHGIKLPDSLISAIGNTIKAHTFQNETYHFDLTKDFNWEAGDFGDDGSCYWGSNESAREMMYENDAFAIRFYDSDGDGMGRAWIYNTGEFWVLWNGYGFEGTPTLIAAQIFSEFLSVFYKRISLVNYGTNSGTLFINGAIGYAIGASSIIKEVSRFDLDFEPLISCRDCGRYIHDEDNSYRSPDGEIYCEYCFYDIYDYCEWCSETCYREDLYEADGMWVCEYCRDNRFGYCEKCEEYHRGEKCPNCREEKVSK